MRPSSTECERARLSASLAADGEISELELAWLRAHLASCRGCAASTRVTGRLVELLRTAPRLEPRRPLFSSRERRPAVRRWQLVASAAAVLAALAAGGLAGTLAASGHGSAAPAPAATHKLLIEQSLLALSAVSPAKAPRGGRVIAS